MRARPIARVLAFAVPLAAYVRTLSPSVGPNDSGELTAVAATLGIAHPSGYPLFTLFGHAWTRLPLPGTVSWRLNLFCAVCVAAAALVFFEIARRVIDLAWPPAPGAAPGTAGRPADEDDDEDSGPPWAATRTLAALAGALVFAFARTVWAQAVAVEVYALHLFMTLAVVWLFLRAAYPAPGRTSRPRDWALFAFVTGLAFSNHLTVFVVAPALVFLYFRSEGVGRAGLVRLGAMALPFAAGLLPYAYLALRSAGAFPFSAPAAFDWGGVSRSLDKFVWHVTGRQYGIWMFSGLVGENVRKFLLLLPFQLGLLGVVLAPAGLWVAFRRSRPLGIALALLVVGPAGYAVTYSIPDIDAYFLPAFAGAGLCAALGGYLLVRPRPHYAAVLLVLPVAAVAVNAASCDRSADWSTHDFATNMVAAFEPNALVISGEWETFDSAFWYLQRVENLRPDIAVLNIHLMRRTWFPAQVDRLHPGLLDPVRALVPPFLEQAERLERGETYVTGEIQQRYVDLINGIIAAHVATRPVYLTETVGREQQRVGIDYDAAPAGFAVRLVPKGTPLPPPVDRFDLERILAVPANRGDAELQRVLDAALRGIARSAEYARRRDDGPLARRLDALAARLRARSAATLP